MVLTDGRIEIEIAPASVHVEHGEKLPTLVADEELPSLTDRDIRDAIEATQR